MDFLMKQQSIMLNALINPMYLYHRFAFSLQRTLGFHDHKSFYCDAKYLRFTDVPKSSNIHQLFLGRQLPHV